MANMQVVCHHPMLDKKLEERKHDNMLVLDGAYLRGNELGDDFRCPHQIVVGQHHCLWMTCRAVDQG